MLITIKGDSTYLFGYQGNLFISGTVFFNLVLTHLGTKTTGHSFTQQSSLSSCHVFNTTLSDVGIVGKGLHHK